MSWIQTFTKKHFAPQTARPEDFDIRDIAHSLSLLCRFNGHCKTFYSVADHSVRVSKICGADHALWGLLHDLGEAYVSDLPRPVKQEFPAFSTLENQLLEIAAQAFSLPWPMPKDVRTADDILLATEARDLMDADLSAWGLTQTPLDERIEPLNPADAEQAFLRRYTQLHTK